MYRQLYLTVIMLLLIIPVVFTNSDNIITPELVEREYVFEVHLYFTPRQREPYIVDVYVSATDLFSATNTMIQNIAEHYQTQLSSSIDSVGGMGEIAQIGVSTYVFVEDNELAN